MATKEDLEKSVIFRFGKVVLMSIAILIILATAGIWYLSLDTSYNASSAYFVCGTSIIPHQLTDEEKNEIEMYKKVFFDAQSPNEVDLNKQCYADYSSKDPNSATQEDINAFRASQTGTNGHVYTIEGINTYENWHWIPFLVALLIEVLIYIILEKIGLYIAGGKEAFD